MLLHIQFSGREAFDAALAKGGERIMADIPNYTDIPPVAQFDEPVESSV